MTKKKPDLSLVMLGPMPDLSQRLPEWNVPTFIGSVPLVLERIAWISDLVNKITTGGFKESRLSYINKRAQQ